MIFYGKFIQMHVLLSFLVVKTCCGLSQICLALEFLDHLIASLSQAFLEFWEGKRSHKIQKLQFFLQSCGEKPVTCSFKLQIRTFW